jgi:hypothetical protein
MKMGGYYKMLRVVARLIRERREEGVALSWRKSGWRLLLLRCVAGGGGESGRPLVAGPDSGLSACLGLLFACCLPGEPAQLLRFWHQ